MIIFGQTNWWLLKGTLEELNWTLVVTNLFLTNFGKLQKIIWKLILKGICAGVRWSMAVLGQGIINWLVKVSLYRVYSGCKNNHCHKVLTYILLGTAKDQWCRKREIQTNCYLWKSPYVNFINILHSLAFFMWKCFTQLYSSYSLAL